MQPTDPEYKLLHDKACLYYMNFYQELFAICCKATKDEAKAEELMSDVVLARLPRIIELWDQSKPLTQYVNSNIRWYVLKELVKERKLKQRYINEMRDDGEYVEQSLIQQENVEELLKGLNELERHLVLLYVVGGYNYREIGELSGLTRIRVSNIVNDALDRLYERLAK